MRNAPSEKIRSTGLEHRFSQYETPDLNILMMDAAAAFEDTHRSGLPASHHSTEIKVTAGSLPITLESNETVGDIKRAKLTIDSRQYSLSPVEPKLLGAWNGINHDGLIDPITLPKILLKVLPDSLLNDEFFDRPVPMDNQTMLLSLISFMKNQSTSSKDKISYNKLFVSGAVLESAGSADSEYSVALTRETNQAADQTNVSTVYQAQFARPFTLVRGSSKPPHQELEQHTLNHITQFSYYPDLENDQKLHIKTFLYGKPSVGPQSLANVLANNTGFAKTSAYETLEFIVDQFRQG